MTFEGSMDKKATDLVVTAPINRLTKQEKKAIVDALSTMLRGVEMFSFPDVFDQVLGARRAWRVGEEREFRLMLNRAMNVLLDEGIDFGVVQGSPGTYERKDSGQMERRSKGWRRKGLKALERGVKRLLVAAQSAPQEERERISRSAGWQALKLAMASRSPNAKKLPPGIED